MSQGKVRDFVGDALRTLTDEANTRRRTNPQEIPDLWLTDEDDERDIATPVSRLIYRRLPAGSDELGNPDLGDAIEAIVALWFYARKQVGKLRDWRRAKRDVENQHREDQANAA